MANRDVQRLDIAWRVTPCHYCNGSCNLYTSDLLMDCEREKLEELQVRRNRISIEDDQFSGFLEQMERKRATVFENRLATSTVFSLVDQHLTDWIICKDGNDIFTETNNVNSYCDDLVKKSDVERCDDNYFHLANIRHRARSIARTGEPLQCFNGISHFRVNTMQVLNVEHRCNDKTV